MVPSSSYTYIKGYFGLPSSEVVLTHWSVLRMEKFVKGLGGLYDYVILDSSPEPSVGRMVAAVSDYIIVPTRPRTLDVFGAIKFIGALSVHVSTIRSVSERLPRILGVLITMYWHDPERITRTKRLIEARVVEELAYLRDKGYLPEEYKEEFPGVYRRVTFSTSIPMASKDVDRIVEEKAIISYAVNTNNKLTRAYCMLLNEVEARIAAWEPLRLRTVVEAEQGGSPRYEYEQIVLVDTVTVADKELGRYVGSWVEVEVYAKDDGSLLAARRTKVRGLKTITGEIAGYLEVRVDRRHSGRHVVVLVKPVA